MLGDTSNTQCVNTAGRGVVYAHNLAVVRADGGGLRGVSTSIKRLDASTPCLADWFAACAMADAAELEAPRVRCEVDEAQVTSLAPASVVRWPPTGLPLIEEPEVDPFGHHGGSSELEFDPFSEFDLDTSSAAGIGGLCIDPFAYSKRDCSFDPFSHMLGGGVYA